MPRCTNAECTRNNRRERKASGLQYRHCQAAQTIYQAIRPSLEAGDYDTARRMAAKGTIPCPRCGVTPRFVLTFPEPDTDPTGFSLLEIQGASIQTHQTPAGYPRCQPNTVHIPTLVEVQPEPDEDHGMIAPDLLVAAFVGSSALDPAYGQQAPGGLVLPAVMCNFCAHAGCDHARELKAVIAETPVPD